MKLDIFPYFWLFHIYFILKKVFFLYNGNQMTVHFKYFEQTE
ncbi:hypothetical protein MY7_2363 [Bacillus sp. 5B6]|nr:hypothetical protein MY7_2363 [Bacillus sp. 5B6]